MIVSKTGTGTLHGSLLIAAITSVCSSGFLLFGYDQGVMSGVVVSTYWLDQMGNPPTIIVSTIAALYDVGAMFGAIFAAFTAEPLGRKRTLMLGAAVLIVGAILMGSSYGRPQMMVSRIITGIGIGYITSVTPVYQSEVSAAAQRGWQVCCQLTTMLGGLMLAYWINYGMYFHHGAVQWRFPLLFQIIFALYILVVTPFLPDTPRWLMRHDPNGEKRGLDVLAKLRGRPMDDPLVQREKNEILDAIRIEAKEEGTWMDLFRDGGIAANKRFYLALGIQFMQQMSGINIVTYYAPTLFQDSLSMSARMSLLLGCLLQVWYIIASFLTWYTIDRVGRRPLFISMALLMCGVLVAEAVCVAQSTAHHGAAIGAVFFVFVFEAAFTWGWMATVWVYPPEILPLKIRAKGAALAAAADFAGNFLVVEITPPALKNIGWKTYVIFAVLNVVNAIIVWLFYPETARLSLEAVDRIFVAQELGEGRDRRRLDRRLQWRIVDRAKDAIDKVKRGEVEDEEAAGTNGSASANGSGDLKDAERVERI